jgi:hypothetical protein
MLNVPYSSQQLKPFVRFEEREHGVNQEASERAGRPVPAFRTFACITSAGSKDSHEKFAEEWLAQIRAQAIKGEYNPEWSQYFHLQYEEFKKGNELPRDGTPMRTCPIFSKDQIARARAIDITTVEDLASIPDTGLSMLGLDGRYMRDLARTFIKDGQDHGLVSKQVADLNAKVDNLMVELERWKQRALEAESDVSATRKPGRPRKDEAA